MFTHTRYSALALVALAFFACDSKSTEKSAAAPASASVSAKPVEYVELTTAGANPSETLPMVVAIHGLGDRPEAFAELFSGFEVKTRLMLLRAPTPYSSGFAWFPFSRTDSDQVRARGISDASERVAATMRELVTKRPTRGKPIITGFSQGGMISFAVFVKHGDLIRAAFPVGGTLPEPLWPPSGGAPGSGRLVALNGEDDTLVPIGPARRATDALRERGRNATIEGQPGIGHQISSGMRQRLFALLREELAHD